MIKWIASKRNVLLEALVVLVVLSFLGSSVSTSMQPINNDVGTTLNHHRSFSLDGIIASHNYSFSSNLASVNTGNATIKGHTGQLTIISAVSSTSIESVYGFSNQYSNSSHIAVGKVKNTTNGETFGVGSSSNPNATSIGSLTISSDLYASLGVSSSNSDLESNQTNFNLSFGIHAFNNNELLVIFTLGYTQDANGFCQNYGVNVNGKPAQGLNGTDIQVDGGIWSSIGVNYFYLNSSGIYSVNSIVSSTNGAIELIGFVISPNVNYNTSYHNVIFNESNLPPKTSWSVTLNGSTESSTSSTITFSVPNGTYQYSIMPLTGYVPFITSGNVHISGKSVSISIYFIKAGSMPVGEGMIYYNGKIYYANTNQNKIEVFSAITHKYLTSISVGSEPNSLLLFKSYIISVNSGNNNISVINSTTNKVVQNINVGSDPVGISAVPSLYQIYVTNFISKNVSIISTGYYSNGTPNFSNINIKSFNVQGNPTGIVANPFVPVDLYVSITNLHSVAVYSYEYGSTFKYDGLINTGNAPMGVTLNDVGELFIADSGSSNVTVAYPSQQSSVPGPQSNTTSISLGRSDPVGVVASSNTANSVTFVTYGDGDISYLESFLPYNSFLTDINVSSSVALLNSSSLYYFNNGNISMFQLHSVVFDFSGGPGAFQIDNISVGAPSLALPVGLLLANGSYAFFYSLQSGYDNLHFQTSGAVTLSNYSSKEYLTVAGSGTVTAESNKIVGDLWTNSNAFDITSGSIPLQLLASLFGSNSQIPDILVYQIVKSSSVSEEQFSQNLTSYFNISVPSSFLPSGVIIIHIPFIQIVNAIFDQNIPVKQYSFDIGALFGSVFMENHPYINLTESGSLNIALTLSYSTKTSGLFDQVLNIAVSLVTSLLKNETGGIVKTLTNSIGIILDHLDISINIIQSSLNQAGGLSSYAIFDFQNLYNVLKKVSDINSLLMDLISIPQYIEDGQDYTLIAAVVPPPFDIFPLALSFYSYSVALIKSAEVISGSLSLMFPSLNNNHIFNDIKEGISIAGIIADPKGSTVQPTFYNSNGGAILGYESNIGNEITNSSSGYYYSNSYGFIAFMNGSNNYRMQLNHIGGNYTVPYIIQVQSNLSEESYTYAGIVENNSYSYLNISSNNGTIAPQVYLSPSAKILERLHYFQIMVTPTLSNGTIIGTNNGFILIDGNSITMFRNGTELEAKLPYGMNVKGTADIYVNSSYAGGFTTIVIPEIYTATFTETGLPTGTTWSVTLNGTMESSTSSTIAFIEPNGTYAYTISNVSGYSVSPSSGSIVVNGNNISKTITYTVVPPSKTQSSGIPNIEIYFIIAVVVAIVAIGLAVAVTRKRK